MLRKIESVLCSKSIHPRHIKRVFILFFFFFFFIVLSALRWQSQQKKKKFENLPDKIWAIYIQFLRIHLSARSRDTWNVCDYIMRKKSFFSFFIFTSIWKLILLLYFHYHMLKVRFSWAYATKSKRATQKRTEFVLLERKISISSTMTMEKQVWKSERMCI